MFYDSTFRILLDLFILLSLSPPSYTRSVFSLAPLFRAVLTFPPAYLKNVLPELPWNGIKCLLQSNVDQYQDYLTSDAMNQAVALEENRLCALCT